MGSTIYSTVWYILSIDIIRYCPALLIIVILRTILCSWSLHSRLSVIWVRYCLVHAVSPSFLSPNFPNFLTNFLIPVLSCILSDYSSSPFFFILFRFLLLICQLPVSVMRSSQFSSLLPLVPTLSGRVYVIIGQPTILVFDTRLIGVANVIQQNTRLLTTLDELE